MVSALLEGIFLNINDFREQSLNLIKQQTFSGDFVRPDYEGLNLENILPQIGAVFGIGDLKCSTSPEDCLTELEGIRKVVLVIFDGLGYNRLLHYIGNRSGTFSELTEKGVLKPMTTVFPSTTATALTSVFTGLSPAQHQIIGYHMYSKKYGLIYNTLDMKPIYGYSAKVELAKDYTKNLQLILPIVEQNGIKTRIITQARIIGSGLSQITHRDTKLVPYNLSSDMWTHTVTALMEPGPSLSVVYYSGVDNLAHKYGAYSKETTFEISTIEHSLKEFINNIPEQTKEETLLVIVSDHGISEAKQPLYLKDMPELMQHLILPPVGDGRATYLYCKPNRTSEFQSAFEQGTSGFMLFSTEQLIREGIFGEPISNEGLREKLGDLAVLSNSDGLLDYPFFEDDRQSPQLGAHGGMTAEEMIVPLLSIRLSKL